jgi:hypothetical protein
MNIQFRWETGSGRANALIDETFRSYQRSIRISNEGDVPVLGRSRFGYMTLDACGRSFLRISGLNVAFASNSIHRSSGFQRHDAILRRKSLISDSIR